MSDQEDYQIDDIPFEGGEEEVIGNKPAKEYKRKPTEKQLETMRANLEKGRMKRQAMTQQQKKKQEDYDEYLINDSDAPKKVSKGRQPTAPAPSEDDYSDYTDVSDDEVEYKIIPKKKHSKQKAPTKKESKEQTRLDKIENILLSLVKEQKRSRSNLKQPKIIKNTVIQIPKSSSAAIPTSGTFSKLLKLF